MNPHENEIAERLALNYLTADTRLRNISAKLHLNTRTSAVAKGSRNDSFGIPRLRDAMTARVLVSRSANGSVFYGQNILV